MMAPTSVKIAPKDRATLMHAAKIRGVKLSTFIREAALEKAASEVKRAKAA